MTTFPLLRIELQTGRATGLTGPSAELKDSEQSLVV